MSKRYRVKDKINKTKGTLVHEGERLSLLTLSFKDRLSKQWLNCCLAMLHKMHLELLVSSQLNHPPTPQLALMSTTLYLERDIAS